MDKQCVKCSRKFSSHDGRRTCCDACMKKRQSHKLRMRNRVRECEECRCDLTHRAAQARYCFDCSGKRALESMRRSKYRPITNDNEKARAITKYAVKVGFLPHPENFKCTDCTFRPAKCYDHRDYRKPLEVDPVCLPCNSSRGRGEPLHAPYVEAVTQ